MRDASSSLIGTWGGLGVAACFFLLAMVFGFTGWKAKMRFNQTEGIITPELCVPRSEMSPGDDTDNIYVSYRYLVAGKTYGGCWNVFDLSGLVGLSPEIPTGKIVVLYDPNRPWVSRVDGWWQLFGWSVVGSIGCAFCVALVLVVRWAMGPTTRPRRH